MGSVGRNPWYDKPVDREIPGLATLSVACAGSDTSANTSLPIACSNTNVLTDITKVGMLLEQRY